MNIVCIGYRDWALEIYKSLPQLHPNKNFIILNNPPNLDLLPLMNPDLILWYGWSDIISSSYLDNYNSIMLHPSPLPKYRGGSPIQNQIINGETISSVTLFKMDQDIDTGGIIEQKEFSLEGNLNDILNRIINLGITLTNNLINNYPDIILLPQDDNESSYFKRRKPFQSEITIEEIENTTAKKLYNKIRALQDPYPNAYITCKNNTKLYITHSHL